jgi:glycosyltransferase involved in cell wall biosynthesis
MQVSVALATYNGARYLDKQLESLAAQSLKPLEIVVSDDGSSDGTLQVVHEFATRTDIPLNIMPNEAQVGYRLNFRRAAQSCTGDLIAFCDQDDIWREDKLERVVELFSSSEVQLVYHNAIVFSENSVRLLHDPALEKLETRKDHIPPFKYSNGLLQVFRRELLKYDHLWDMSLDHHEENVILAHDQWYFFLACLLGRVEFIDLPLLKYRQHQSNTYGVRVTESRLDRFLMKFVHFGDQDAWSARSAESRATIAEEIARVTGRKDILSMAADYRLLAQALRRRSNIYSDPALAQRLESLLQSLYNGDYGSRRWAFKKSSIVRDVWKGLLLRRKHDYSRS